MAKKAGDKKAGAKKADSKKIGTKKAGAKKAKLVLELRAEAGVAPKRKGRLARLRVPPPPPDAPAGTVLDRLWSVVMSRRDADPAVSHSARLLSRGTAKVAQKFGEEAVECLIEATQGNRAALIAESADVLYHMLVMWVDGGVRPEDVWTELVRREGVSGIAEKASRARRLPMALGVRTSKIP